MKTAIFLCLLCVISGCKPSADPTLEARLAKLEKRVAQDEKAMLQDPEKLPEIPLQFVLYNMQSNLDTTELRSLDDHWQINHLSNHVFALQGIVLSNHNDQLDTDVKFLGIISNMQYIFRLQYGIKR